MQLRHSDFWNASAVPGLEVLFVTNFVSCLGQDCHILWKLNLAFKTRNNLSFFSFWSFGAYWDCCSRCQPLLPVSISAHYQAFSCGGVSDLTADYVKIMFYDFASSFIFPSPILWVSGEKGALFSVLMLQLWSEQILWWKWNCFRFGVYFDLNLRLIFTSRKHNSDA